MRKFLFASHAYLAEGVKSALELIMGEQESVEVMCAYLQEDYDIKQEIKKYMDNLSEEAELIIITDVLGGSVNNEFVENKYISDFRTDIVSCDESDMQKG